jgi:hypothetical protein
MKLRFFPNAEHSNCWEKRSESTCQQASSWDRQGQFITSLTGTENKQATAAMGVR